MTAAGVAYHYRPRRRASTDWMTRALCLGRWNFTEKPVAEQIEICQSGCPVKDVCAEFGVDGPPVSYSKYGEGVVYGGLRPRTIKRLQKARGVS